MVPLGFLMEVVESEELIKKCHGCRDYVDEAKNYHLSIKALPLSPKRVFRSERSQPRKSTAGKEHYGVSSQKVLSWPLAQSFVSEPSTIQSLSKSCPSKKHTHFFAL